MPHDGPAIHTSCTPQYTKFHFTPWDECLDLRTQTSRFAEADPCPYSHWDLWRQICWRLFAGRLCCPFCRQVSSRHFKLTKNARPLGLFVWLDIFPVVANRTWMRERVRLISVSKECKLISAKILTAVSLLLFQTTTTSFIPGILSSSMTRIFHMTIFGVIVSTTCFSCDKGIQRIVFATIAGDPQFLGGRTIQS